MDYNYKLDIEKDFEQVFSELQSKYPNRVSLGWPNVTYSRDEESQIASQLESYNIPVKLLKIDKKEYLEYFDKVNYTHNYPNYYVGNIIEKSFEQFLFIKECKPKTKDIIIDIASEGAIFPEILRKYYKCKVYAQDIMYPSGIHGDKIGSDAAFIPLENETIDCASVLCSLEHFENYSDILFFKECIRLLKKGGSVFVVPLYLHLEHCVVTDPRQSVPGKVEFDPEANIYCVKEYQNRHGRFYSPKELYKRIIQPMVNFLDFEIIYIDNYKEIDASVYARFALKAVKK